MENLSFEQAKKNFTIMFDVIFSEYTKHQHK